MARAIRPRTIEATPELRAKALLVHEQLCAEYGCPVAFFHALDPLSELVSSLLSHRTKNSDSGRAFRTLREHFPSWDAVRDAPVGDVESAIAAATWPEQKAPRIQATLRELTDRLGTLGDESLDFLGTLPVPEARAWLESITGIGPKTSAAVLLFSRLRRPALPVDSHHHRVAERLALMPPGVAVGPAHALLEAQLPADWDAQRVYDNHEALMFHGQRVCFHRDPACERCVVLDLCPTGQRRLARRADDAAERSLPPSTLGSRAARLRRPQPVASVGFELDLTAAPATPEDRTMTRDPNDLNDPRHAELSADHRAHGTHGRGKSSEQLVEDTPIDSGDDPQAQTGDPASFGRNAVGRMGGPGWGSEAAGGSSVDEHSPDAETSVDRDDA